VENCSDMRMMGLRAARVLDFGQPSQILAFVARLLGVSQCVLLARGAMMLVVHWESGRRGGGGCREGDDLDGALSSLAMAGSSLAWSTIGLHGVGYITVSLWFLSWMVYNR
jgi:hypothetical protein